MIQNGYNETTGVYSEEAVVTPPSCSGLLQVEHIPPCYKPKCSACALRHTCVNFTPDYTPNTFTCTTTGEFYS